MEKGAIGFIVGFVIDWIAIILLSVLSTALLPSHSAIPGPSPAEWAIPEDTPLEPDPYNYKEIRDYFNSNKRDPFKPPKYILKRPERRNDCSGYLYR